MHVLPVDGLFLGWPDHLYVRCQLQPWGNGKIVKHLEPILIPQKFPGRKQTCELGTLDIHVVVP